MVALPATRGSIDEFGESKSFDLQANLVGKNWGLDALTEQHKGYHIEGSSLPVCGGIHKEQRKDTETVSTGISGLFFFFKRRSSVRATFNFYERQMKSAGSPMAMLIFNRFRFKAYSLVSNLSKNNSFGDGGDFKELGYSSVAVAPCYAYTYALKKKRFLAGAASVGPSFNFLTTLTAQAAIQLWTFARTSMFVGH